jgi:hypothetical protein
VLHLQIERIEQMIKTSTKQSGTGRSRMLEILLVGLVLALLVGYAIATTGGAPDEAEAGLRGSAQRRAEQSRLSDGLEQSEADYYSGR